MENKLYHQHKINKYGVKILHGYLTFKRVGKTNLHIIDESGFSRRRSLLKMGNLVKIYQCWLFLEKIMVVVKPGVNNVNVLMDGTAFGVDLMTDENGNARS